MCLNFLVINVLSFQPESLADLSDHMHAFGRQHAVYSVAHVTTLNQTNKRMQQVR